MLIDADELDRHDGDLLDATGFVDDVYDDHDVRDVLIPFRRLLVYRIFLHEMVSTVKENNYFFKYMELAQKYKN